MKQYIRVSWHHEFAGEPVELFSEIVDGRETRKVEIYRDGHADFADGIEARGASVLSQSLMPSLDDIAVDPQFNPERIAPERFEEVWRLAQAG